MREEIRNLLKVKRKLFLEYENVTLSLFTQDVDAITDGMEKRAELIAEIDRADAALAEIGEGSAAGRRLCDIAKNRCDYKSLNEEERRLFEEGQDLYTVIARIKEKDDELPEHFSKIMDRLLQDIKQNNVNKKFAGYLKQMDYGAKGALYNKKR